MFSVTLLSEGNECFKVPSHMHISYRYAFYNLGVNNNGVTHVNVYLYEYDVFVSYRINNPFVIRNY